MRQFAKEKLIPRLSGSQPRIFRAYKERRYAEFAADVKGLDTEKALSVVEAAFYWRSNDMIPLSMWARLLRRAGRQEEALALLGHLDVGLWSGYMYLTAASCLRALRRSQEALDLLEELGRDRWNTHIYLIAANCLRDLERPQEALDLLGELDSVRWNIYCWNVGAGTLRELERPQDAIDLLEGLGRDRWDCYSYNIAANALRDLGMSQEALDLLEGFGRERWNSFVFNIAAACLRDLGMSQEALGLLEGFGRERWDDVSYYTAASAHVSLGNFERGVEAFFSCPKIGAEYLEHLKHLGASFDLQFEAVSLYRYRDALEEEKFLPARAALIERIVTHLKDAAASGEPTPSERLGSLRQIIDGPRKRDFGRIFTEGLQAILDLPAAEIAADVEKPEIQQLIGELSPLKRGKGDVRKLSGELKVLIDAVLTRLIEAVRGV